ncbi:hypothetical protein U0070_005427 [Myodes glareolus]|uniref:Protein cornichon homolog 3 n=1 Tax=Myodes glareolus TaxID=447135 RepID=A0AAW0HA99_MYOGA
MGGVLPRSDQACVCVSLLPLQLVLPEYSIHSLFCIMFLCAQEWLTLGLNVPLLFYHFWRYFHCPADSSELAYDPPVVMNADTLSYCQKEAWCKLAFYLLSFFYYLYWVMDVPKHPSAISAEAEEGGGANFKPTLGSGWHDLHLSELLTQTLLMERPRLGTTVAVAGEGPDGNDGDTQLGRD